MNFLKELNIKYEYEPHKLFGLKGDMRNSLEGETIAPKYRVPDFYLPSFKVYIEHFGWYNKNKESRLEYDHKRDLYFKNGVPVIILHPHELGIIQYAFHVQMVKVLKVERFGLKKQLYRYRLKRFLKHNGGASIYKAVLFSFLFLISLLFETGLDPDFEFLIQLVLVANVLGNTILAVAS